MTELVEFLRARLDEDEWAAQAATAGPWRHSPDKRHHEPGTPRFGEAVFSGAAGKDATCVATTGETDDQQSMRDAEHIARHDPARVLREVAAKRALVDFLDPQGAPDGEGRYVAERALALLALPYSHLPGYRDEWKPGEY